MKLYTFPPSPNSRKIMAVAHHLGIDLDVHFVDLRKGEQMKPEFLALNPNHKIPTLQDGDFVLWESNAIMQYLAASHSDKLLWPREPRPQADVSRWLFWQATSLGPACDILAFERFVKSMLGLGETDPAEEARGEEMFHSAAAVLDAHLQGREWVVGEHMTLADFALGAPLSTAEFAHLPLDGYAEIRRWYAGLEKVRAWQASAPA